MEELIRRLFQCCECKDILTELFRYGVNRRLPEPLLGRLSPNPALAIVGINPGGPLETSERYDEESYLDCYRSGECRKISKEEVTNRGWARGYLYAYKRLVKKEPISKPEEEFLEEFNEKVTILNVIKCGCPNIRKLSDGILMKARKKCLPYLIEQLEELGPRIILFHSRFACNTALDFLKNREYTLERDTCDLGKLRKPGKMDDISKEYIIAKTKNGMETLFLFNWHLSWFGRAKQGIEKKLEEKQKIVDDFLRSG